MNHETNNQAALKGILSENLGTVLALLGSFGVAKYIAFVSGSTGIGYYSTFRQVILFATLVIGLNSQITLGREIAYYKDKPNRHQIIGRYVASAFTFLILSSMALGAVFFLFPQIAASLALETSSDRTIQLSFLLAAIILTVFNQLILGILLGYGLHHSRGLAVSVGALLMVVVSFGVVQAANANEKWHYLLLIIITQGAGILISCLWFLYRSGQLPVRFVSLRAANRADVWHFVRSSGLITLIGLLDVSMNLFMRSYTTETNGIETAGLFFTGLDISVILGTTFAAPLLHFLLPRLTGEANETAQQPAARAAIATTSRYFLTIFVTLLTLIALNRILILRILYSQEFYAAASYWQWTTLADFFRGYVWVVGAIFIARGRLKPYLASELVSHGFIWLIILILRPPALETVASLYLLLSILRVSGLLILSRRIIVDAPFPWLKLAIGFAIVAASGTIAYQPETSWLARIGLNLGVLTVLAVFLLQEWREEVQVWVNKWRVDRMGK